MSEDEGFTSNEDHVYDERYLSSLKDNKGKIDEARYQMWLVYIVIASLFVGVGCAVWQSTNIIHVPSFKGESDVYYFDDDDGAGDITRHFGRYIGPYLLKEVRAGRVEGWAGGGLGGGLGGELSITNNPSHARFARALPLVASFLARSATNLSPSFLLITFPTMTPPIEGGMVSSSTTHSLTVPTVR